MNGKVAKRLRREARKATVGQGEAATKKIEKANKRLYKDIQRIDQSPNDPSLK